MESESWFVNLFHCCQSVDSFPHFPRSFLRLLFLPKTSQIEGKCTGLLWDQVLISFDLLQFSLYLRLGGCMRFGRTALKASNLKKLRHFCLRNFCVYSHNMSSLIPFVQDAGWGKPWLHREGFRENQIGNKENTGKMKRKYI